MPNKVTETNDTRESSQDILENSRLSTLIFLPTGEEVSVSAAKNSYRGILESLKITDLADPELQGKNAEKQTNNSSTKKKNLSAIEDSHLSPAAKGDCKSLLLTPYDVKNRSHGYSLFLPDNKEKCDEYWRLGYGIKLKGDGERTNNQNNEQHNENNGRLEDARNGNLNNGGNKLKKGMKNRQNSQQNNGSNKDIIGDKSEAKKSECNGYHLTEVTMELGDSRIVPTQLLAR